MMMHLRSHCKKLAPSVENCENIYVIVLQFVKQVNIREKMLTFSRLPYKRWPLRSASWAGQTLLYTIKNCATDATCKGFHAKAGLYDEATKSLRACLR